MHSTKFSSVVERDLEILNPTSYEKLMLLADYCSISKGDRVLDVGSGKGYMLRRWAECFGIQVFSGLSPTTPTRSQFTIASGLNGVYSRSMSS